MSGVSKQEPKTGAIQLVVGILYLLAHVAAPTMMWVAQKQDKLDSVELKAILEIMVPGTVVNSISIVSWFMRARNVPSSNQKGLWSKWDTVICSIVIVFFLLYVGIATARTFFGFFVTASDLSFTYACIETVFGGIMSVIVGSLFEKDRNEKNIV
jgi:hypothetical protein